MKWIAAVVLAVLLAVGAGARGWILVPSECSSITPDNWFLWWWRECGKDTAGGGGSGVGN